MQSVHYLHVLHFGALPEGIVYTMRLEVHAVADKDELLINHTFG